ncbi:MAG: hypothetical protein ACLFVP_02140 [Candidatus Bathyarchaeia archaeon]
MDDKTLGSAIVIFTCVIMITYFLWAFGPYLGPAFKWITPEIGEWAYRIPIILAVYTLLSIIIWIGYTMATTPPPIPLENPLDLERNKRKEDEYSEKEEPEKLD